MKPPFDIRLAWHRNAPAGDANVLSITNDDGTPFNLAAATRLAVARPEITHMLVVRFRETFRERMPEWGMSIWLLLWGLRLWSAGDMMGHPLFQILGHLFTQLHWAEIAVITGLGRLVCLLVNGAWRPTYHLRGLGSFVSCMICFELLAASLLLGWQSPSTATYALLLFLDGWSLWFAAGDACAADCQSRRSRRGPA